jgi:pyrroloquinoline-quinone synthase
VARGTRFAVDAYLHFCLTRPWIEAAAAALTEMFSPDLMAARVRAWREHYDWIKPDGYAYFENRIPIVRDDARYTLDLVLTHCAGPDAQRAAIKALSFKCDVLWAMLDAIDYAGGIATDRTEHARQAKRVRQAQGQEGATTVAQP